METTPFNGLAKQINSYTDAWEYDEESDEIVHGADVDEHDPVCFADDEYDTAAEQAAVWLINAGATEASSSCYHPGIWYSSDAEPLDDGSYIMMSHHLRGFSDDECIYIYRRIMNFLVER